MRLRLIEIYQHKESGEWISGLTDDGCIETDPKMCNAWLFYGGSLGKFPSYISSRGSGFKVERIWIRWPTIPRPTGKKKTKKAKPKKKVAEEKAGAV